MDKQVLKSSLNRIDIEISDHQMAAFELYLEQIVAWNERFNLTAIAEPLQIVIKHFYDSLLGMATPTWKTEGSLLDLGSGAGLPGIPLKILNPSLKLTLVDALQKRVSFLEHMITALELEWTQALHARAEELGQNQEHREKYDVVTSRAVARLSVLAEYCLPLVKKDGIFLAYKGPEGRQECTQAKKALELLGGRIERMDERELPDGSQRILIYVRKHKATPALYPRKAGVPAKKPLE